MKSKGSDEGLPKESVLEFGLLRNPIDSLRPFFFIRGEAALTFEQAVDALERMAELLEKIAPPRGPRRRARR